MRRERISQQQKGSVNAKSSVSRDRNGLLRLSIPRGSIPPHSVARYARPSFALIGSRGTERSESARKPPPQGGTRCAISDAIVS